MTRVFVAGRIPAGEERAEVSFAPRYRGKDSLAVSAVICSRAGGCAPSGMPVGIRICHARSGWVGRSCLPAMMRARGVLHARMSWGARGKVSGLSDDAGLCVRMGSRPGRIRRIGKKRPPYRDAEKKREKLQDSGLGRSCGKRSSVLRRDGGKRYAKIPFRY